MPYESAPELSAFFQRMGVPLQVVDDPNLGKYVVATVDIMPDVVEEGKPNAGAQLETAALFEESGIASWPMTELLRALKKNYRLLLNNDDERTLRVALETAGKLDALLGYCNESLALCFAEKGAGEACLTIVPDTLFDSKLDNSENDEEEDSSNQKEVAVSSLASTPSTTSTFLYSSPEAQQRDVITAAILGPRGALRSLRAYHTALEAAAEQEGQPAVIPISVEAIARSVSTAVVRFLRALDRSVKGQFSQLEGTPSTATPKKRLALLRELLKSIEGSEMNERDEKEEVGVVEGEGAEESEDNAVTAAEAAGAGGESSGAGINPFVANLFETSVRSFNRLIEPPEGSEFEASVNTKEWCRTIRSAIKKNITAVVRSFTAALICEMVDPTAVVAASGTTPTTTFGLSLVGGSFVTKESENDDDGDDEENKNNELEVLKTVLTAAEKEDSKKKRRIMTLAVSSPLLHPAALAACPLNTDVLEKLLAWVPAVVKGWLNDATIITLLGQMTINSQALTAVPAADGSLDGTTPTSSATAGVEVVQIHKDEDDDEDDADEECADNDNSNSEPPANDEKKKEAKKKKSSAKGTIVTKANIQHRVPIFGAAVFTLQSCFNHSCAPNAEVVPTLPYGLGGHDIIVQAIPKDKRISSKGKVGGGGGGGDDDDDEEKEKAKGKKKEKDSSSASAQKEKVKPLIKAGEEVNITYIPMFYLALEDYVARRQRLESYFFVCECKRCFRENAKAEKAEAKKKTKEAKHGGKV